MNVTLMESLIWDRAPTRHVHLLHLVQQSGWTGFVGPSETLGVELELPTLTFQRGGVDVVYHGGQ